VTLGSNPSGGTPREKRETMIIAGIVLLLLAILLGVHIFWTLGVIAIVVGLILLILGRTDHAVGGRRHYF
jgi:uncharacterized membrane protein HdeD (DUF308 family)